MSIAVIGSQALRFHGHSGREPRDLDLVGRMQDASSFMTNYIGDNLTDIYPISEGKKLFAKGGGTIIETELAWEGSTSEALLDLIVAEGDKRWFGGQQVYVASPEVCLALKLSHRYKKNSPAFLKTMGDIRSLRKQGVEIPERLKEFLRIREAETLNYSHPRLNQSKTDFFDASVKYTYDHDTIHEAVKLHDRPAYTYFKEDQAEVMCSRAKFEAQPMAIRLAAVYEESCVLAVERSLVPYPGAMTEEGAFLKSLEKVCTSITSGWFREFAWEHYWEAVDLFHREQGERLYAARFRQGVENGTVALAV